MRCRDRAIRELGKLDEYRDELARADRRMQNALARELERTINIGTQRTEESPQVEAHGGRDSRTW